MKMYEGRKPVVCVCDPELIRLILVKDSENFRDRRAIDLGDEQVNEMMDFLPCINNYFDIHEKSII